MKLLMIELWFETKISCKGDVFECWSEWEKCCDEVV